MLIEIKNWRTEEVIFSLYTEDNSNSIKRTAEEAVKQYISLKDANLSGADLRGANLKYADLSGADLSNADLRFANLGRSLLIGTNLSGANLSSINLNNARISKADLRCADLSNADLGDSNLRYANLSSANLSEADLRGADLSGADLSKADLRGADLRDAYLICAKSVPDLPMACPKEGSFIGWKKIWYYKGDYKGEFIVKLEIPEDAKRSSATGNKCRCSKAKVLEIRNIDTGECVDVITNLNVTSCVYKVGEYVYPDSFDENRWNECSYGIHFFMTEQEAKEY